MTNPQIQEYLTSTLSGIAQHGEVLGSEDAPALLTYWGDLQCPFCRAFSLGPLHDLITQDVRAGELAVRYRPLQTATGDPQVFVLQHTAALAAGDQDLLWHYIETFYLAQGEEGTGYVTGDFLVALAQEVPGLDVQRFIDDTNGGRHVEAVRQSFADAQAAGIGGTPGLMVSVGDQSTAPVQPAPEIIRATIAQLRG